MKAFPAGPPRLSGSSPGLPAQLLGPNNSCNNIIRTFWRKTLIHTLPRTTQNVGQINRTSLCHIYLVRN